MKLLLLGTGGYFPTTCRHTACFYLPEVGVVLDAGTGMCRVGKHLATDHLDVFLSHAHLDHIVGLTCLINLVPEKVLKQTSVYGNASKLAAVREHLFAEPIFPVAPPFCFKPLGNEACLVGGNGRLTAFELKHPGSSLGFRIDWPNHSLAYVTDTTAAANADYIEKIRGVDLLLHEAYFVDDTDNLPTSTGHSSLMPVVELAKAANVKRLILIHIDPRCTADERYDLTTARKTFADLEIGTDNTEIEF